MSREILTVRVQFPALEFVVGFTQAHSDPGREEFSAVLCSAV